MTDTTLNRFLSYGTNAQRLAFTPSVPTPASGPSQAYFWFETDTGDTYVYASATWTKINTGSGGAMALIGSATPNGVTTASFTSIPSTYSNLMIVFSGRSGAGGTGGTLIGAQFNGDTAGNYDYQYAYDNNGGAHGGNTNSGVTSAPIGQLPTSGDIANYPGGSTVIIPNYKGTTQYKQAINFGGFPFAASIGANMYNTNGTAWWRNTAAISRVDVICSGNWVNGSVSLYGLA